MSGAPFHPLNPQQFRDPYPHFARARKECPVGEFEPGFFYVANDSGVREALRTPTHFSSQGNFGLKESVDPPVVTQVDGEQHTRLRAMLEQSLNAQLYCSVHTYISKSVHTLLDQMLEHHAGRADFMACLAAPLPARDLSKMGADTLSCSKCRLSMRG
jgi:cytochrome P450